MSTYEIFSLIIQSISLLSLILLVIQIILSKQHSHKLHEEQRSIQTLQTLTSWNNSLRKETRLAEKIVEKLDRHQCKALYDYSPFYVNEELHNMLCQMCSQYNIHCEKCERNERGEYLVSGILLTELRGNVTNYLNNLEIVALAWQQAIVDKEILLLQFSYLNTPGTKSALEEYRKIAGGGKSYPVLAEFYNEIKKSAATHVEQKKEL